VSAGDRHTHKLMGERDYDRALSDPRFQAILSRGFNVSYEYDVPYLGGYSQDGGTIYIDRDTPNEIKRGKRIYPLRPPSPGLRRADGLARRSVSVDGRPQGGAQNALVNGILIHEHWEKTAMTAWRWGYAESHALATHAENHYARHVLELDPAVYESIWHPVILTAEKKLHRPGIVLPGDLDRTPYMSQ
jgi:hypothetical protein